MKHHNGNSFRFIALCAALYSLNAFSATVSNVVHITLDGMTASYLSNYVTGSPQVFPNFRRLMTEGAFTFNARCDYDVSETVPNHITILTGLPVQQPTNQPNTAWHGHSGTSSYFDKTIHTYGNTNVPYKASTLDVVHDHGLKTAVFLGKFKLFTCTNSYSSVHGAPDLTGPDNGRCKCDFALVDDTAAASSILMGAVTNLLATNPPNYTFLHFVDTDRAGHSYGWGSTAWSNAVVQMDGYLGSIFRAIEINPALSNHTALVVVADHGGGGDLNSGMHFQPNRLLNYTIPMFVWGGGFAPGSNLYAYYSNRADPGTNYVSQGIGIQPLHNGDTANIALSLLGLPEIPGSYFRPTLITAPAEPINLAYAVQAGHCDFAWPISANCELEWADGLGSSWRAVTNGITSDATHQRYSVAPDNSLAMRFFRLRKK